jgi:hypothetical protein
MINGNARSVAGRQLLSRPISLSRSVIGSAGLAVGYTAPNADSALPGVCPDVAILCGLGPADWGRRGGHHDRLVRGRYGEDVSGTFPPGCLLNKLLCSAP